MWRDVILGIDAEAVCHPPANTDQLAQLESALGVSLPGELTALLREMNGVEVAYGMPLVWSTMEIAQRNSQLRREWRPEGMMKSYMSIDSLLFFGEVGNGDLYAFPITPGSVRNEVFLWDHEDDSRSYQASSLSELLQHKQ